MRENDKLNRKRQTFEILLQATSPIAHMKGTRGNFGIAMTEPIIDSAGVDVRCPILTGNSMRHALR